jgi:hypothetical protein
VFVLPTIKTMMCKLVQAESPDEDTDDFVGAPTLTINQGIDSSSFEHFGPLPGSLPELPAKTLPDIELDEDLQDSFAGGRHSAFF